MTKSKAAMVTQVPTVKGYLVTSYFGYGAQIVSCCSILIPEITDPSGKKYILNALGEVVHMDQHSFRAIVDQGRRYKSLKEISMPHKSVDAILIQEAEINKGKQELGEAVRRLCEETASSKTRKG